MFLVSWIVCIRRSGLNAKGIGLHTEKAYNKIAMEESYQPSLGFLKSPQNNSYLVNTWGFRAEGSFNGSFFSKISMVLTKKGEIVQNSIHVFYYPSGGTISFDGEWRIHNFTEICTTSFIVPQNMNSNAEYLVVGGGGGGGFSTEYSAGGGGGGGFLTGSINLDQGSYPVTVGAGGLGSTSKYSAGSKGGDSSLSSIIAYGGGGGGSGVPNVNTGDAISPSSGASGGGGGSQVISRTRSGASGISGQGFPGGNGFGHDTNGNYQGAGGGGGAGSAGGNGNSIKGGDGGAGKEYLGFHYSAGGGGGKRAYSGQGGGIGGSGVGGNGGFASAGSNAIQNSGSGGGGSAGGVAGLNGGNGGSGIVIIRYRFYQTLTISADYSNLSPGSYELQLIADMVDSRRFNTSVQFQIVSSTQKHSFSMKQPYFLLLTLFFFC